MLERKTSVEKIRKHPDNMRKHLPCKFSLLLPFAELRLPPELQRFASSEKGLVDGDLSKGCVSKIRVILKINEKADAPSCLTINKNQSCVGLIDPTPSRRSQTSNNNINLFPFDSIFTESDQQSKLLCSSIADPILDFFRGKDACVFSFGNAGLGKTKTMIGSHHAITEIGVIPFALVCIFKILDQLKIKTKIQYSIRISALEIGNKNIVRDLITHSTGILLAPLADATSPAVSCSEKPNTILHRQKELAADDLPEATRILDDILAARSDDNNDSLSHLQLIIHLYQSESDKFDGAVNMPAPVCRSRLHLLDLGSGRHGTDDSSMLSLQGMSKVILALYTSQRHIPYKENVLTKLLKETLGVNTLTTMLVHISSKEQNYNDTLQIVQLASKLYRTRSRKGRSVGLLLSEETSSCSSSSSGFHSRRLRPHMGIGATIRSSGNSSASSEFDLTSASELSCCETVIYRGNVNLSGSERSCAQRCVQESLKNVSSESDFIISDKDSSNDYNEIPSAIRRRRISPRTNARAWPTTNSGHNTNAENAPELWVDGPNAVYKSDRKNIDETFDHTRLASNTKVIEVEIPISASTRLEMISKETQCDDVWDNESSPTDGSSHSNTLDRKDHRPLSDISECTEETESNVATDIGYEGMNFLNEICPEKDLDDFLESTFGRGSVHQDNQQKISIKEMCSLTKCPSALPLNSNLTDKVNSSKNSKEDEILTTKKEEDKSTNLVRNAKEGRRLCHSASDSKRSTKSDQKDKKHKSKCRKCSKRSTEKPSASLTSSNSTDLSRIASWIQKVEYEIQASNNDDDVFIDDVKANNYPQHTHHRSQPDISSQKERPSVMHVQGGHYPIQDHLKNEAPWINWDQNRVRYSMYGNCQMHPVMVDDFLSSQSPHRNQIISVPRPVTSVSTVSPLSITVPPFRTPELSRKHVQLPNATITRHSISTTRPPLPPVPHQDKLSGNRMSLLRVLNPTIICENPLSSKVSVVPKSKTLPRNMYSDPSSPLLVNKSEQPKVGQYKLYRRTASQELKSRRKMKKESKNIMSILFAPFISLRNKISKAKFSDKNTIESENNIEQSFPAERNILRGLESKWPLLGDEVTPEYILPSPYHLITHPKSSTMPTESNGHGSDSSSQQYITAKGHPSDTYKKYKCRNKSSNNSFKNAFRQRPTSSGYGSIIIKGDSEVSSHNDSSSEYSNSGQNNSSIVNSHCQMKHSISMSNCKYPADNNNALLCQGVAGVPHYNALSKKDGFQIRNISFAQDLILQEKLRISINEERRIVIQYIEANRLRGIPVEASVMNLICFKCYDNFEISNSAKREECRSIIEQIDQEIEQLKQKLTHAQNHLLLITTFDSMPQ